MNLLCIVHLYIPGILHTVIVLLCVGVIWNLSILSISIRVTSLAQGQTYDCSSASETTLDNNGIYAYISYELPKIRWYHDHAKTKHNKTVCIYVGYTIPHKECHAYRAW